MRVLADPERIPLWAPAFADAVSLGASGIWTAIKDHREFALRLVVEERAGTVDYLREVEPGREDGAHIRVVPRPRGGAVVVMTLPRLPEVDPADSRVTVRQELDQLRSLVEAD
jgi:hypothetical protein